MEVQKGIMAAVFNENGRVLVLKRKKNWEGWELVKGGLEDSYRETVLLELEEEAGIPTELVETVKDLDLELEWEFTRDGKDYKKKYKAYAIKVSDEAKVDVTNNPCDEHEHGFFLNPRHVKEMLEYDNGRKVLEKASEELGVN